MNKSLALAVVGVAGLSSFAAAQATGIYSNIASSTTSDVPGLPGVKFTASATSSAIFERPYGSSSGNFWIFVADTDAATTMDQVLILGSGSSGNVVVREGDPILPGSTDLVSDIDAQQSVNTSGDYIYNADSNGATTSDEYIILSTAGTQSAVAREGAPLPAYFGAPGDAYGAFLGKPGLANDGRVGFNAADTVGSLATAVEDFIVFNNSVTAQSMTTVPANQAGGTTFTISTISSSQNSLIAGTGDTLYQASLQGAPTGTTAVLVYNGAVVAQQGQTFTGASAANSSFSEPILGGDGSWYVRATLTGSNDVVVRNGVVLKETDGIVPGGLAGETFDDTLFSSTFFTVGGNSVGDHFYAGTTSNTNPLANAVVIVNLNGVDIVAAREGDQIDLDADGMLDPFFISTFNDYDMFLSDAGMLYFTANITDGTTNTAGTAFTSVGQAFLTIDINAIVPEPASLSLLGLGVLALRRRRA